MYLFDAKSFNNLFYFIEWIRFYSADPSLFEIEEYQQKGDKKYVLWVWLKDVEEPLEDETC